jgi:hypothetical protein
MGLLQSKYRNCEDEQLGPLTHSLEDILLYLLATIVHNKCSLVVSKYSSPSSK